jgi:hypothetical protein
VIVCCSVVVVCLVDVSEARKIAHTMSFNRLLDTKVGAACITFLDLCCVPSQILRIDLQAAKRIYNFLSSSRSSMSSSSNASAVAEQYGSYQEMLHAKQDEESLALARVVRLFQTFQTVQRRRRSIADDDDFALTNADGRVSKQQEQLITKALEEARTLLEDATVELIANRAYDIDGTRNDLDILISDERKLNKEQCWRVVNLFCQHHELPLIATHLIELARANDWINFLFEAQAHGFAARQGMYRREVRLRF